ncbi:MAG TPA: polysaccharide deacetylase family protein [Chitinophagaceae bacterium]|nr:polysaccharide deacetylase family protein [Chitinophagaceae bacterium]
MKRYFIKTPWWLKRIYPGYLWQVPAREKVLYLTFDDGPHPEATPFVLETLRPYQAQATFFCIGNNVRQNPGLYQQILDAGHKVGNHTQQHLNGWKTGTRDYLADVAAAARWIDSELFRPPYGRITRFQAAGVREVLRRPDARIVMWDVLSADFDTTLTGKQCAEYVVLKAEPGSIVVFHDSQKAWDRLRVCLPAVLAHFSAEGYRFHSLASAQQGPVRN